MLLFKEHVSYARSLLEKVQFSPEDASRTEKDFLLEAVQTAIDAGATIINVPDTVGYSNPTEYGAIFKSLIENIESEQEISFFFPLSRRSRNGYRKRTSCHRKRREPR